MSSMVLDVAQEQKQGSGTSTGTEEEPGVDTYTEFDEVRARRKRAWIGGSMDPATFAGSVRRAWSTVGLCPLDVGEDNIGSSPQGAFSLVLDALEVVLTPHAAAAVERVWRARRLPESFAVRRELVNLKKVCKRVWRSGKEMERRLSQMTAFFYFDAEDSEDSAEDSEDSAGCGGDGGGGGGGDDQGGSVVAGTCSSAPGDSGGDGGGDGGADTAVNACPSETVGGGGWPSPRFQQSSRYAELSQCMSSCKGAAEATQDIRALTKAVCCVPRHTNKPRPERLAAARWDQGVQGDETRRRVSEA